jgi:hypothetical protein
MKRTINKQGKPISLEDYAFYCGAQGLPPDDGLEEIEHRFAQQKAKLEHASVPIRKPLEAILEHNAAIKPQVDSEWSEMLGRFGNHPPPSLLAYAIGFLGPIALLVDTALTAPSLDALGISESVVQYVSAFGIASLSAVVFHLTLESFERSRLDRRHAWSIRALAGFTTLGLFCWGILRGHEVAFGADIASNPLGGFLHGHFILACTVFCFITLGSPLAAAFAVGYAAKRIQEARRWKRAHDNHQQLVESTSRAQKSLESEREKLAHVLRELDSERREWQSIFLQHHRRGAERGAREEPLWLIILKTVGVTVAAMLIALPLARFFWPISLLPVAVGCWAFVHFRRLRFTPGYRKFRRQEATHFSVISSPRTELTLPEPHIIDARLEDHT